MGKFLSESFMMEKIVAKLLFYKLSDNTYFYILVFLHFLKISTQILSTYTIHKTLDFRLCIRQYTLTDIMHFFT